MDDKERTFDKQYGILKALWCFDSETSREYLVDIYDNKIIAERVNGKIVDYQEGNQNVNVSDDAGNS